MNKKTNKKALLVFVAITGINQLFSLTDSSTATGKKLTCPEVDMLNSALASRPEGVIRMSLSSMTIRKVQKNLDVKSGSFGTNKNAEKKFVYEQILELLEPVKDFFKEIQNPMVVQFIKPLIFEAIDNAKTSHFIKFCDSKKGIFEYCENEITTCESLRVICSELLMFFESIRLSLSDEAKKAVKLCRDTMKEEAKKKQADKK